MRLRLCAFAIASRTMETILIAAQKGGAGKTTLARNLSVAAAQDGKRVLASIWTHKARSGRGGKAGKLTPRPC